MNEYFKNRIGVNKIQAAILYPNSSWVIVMELGTDNIVPENAEQALELLPSFLWLCNQSAKSVKIEDLMGANGLVWEF